MQGCLKADTRVDDQKSIFGEIDLTSIIPGPSQGLVTNYGQGGLQNGRGAGHVKFYHYEKWGGEVLAMLKGGGGHTKFWGSFYDLA